VFVADYVDRSTNECVDRTLDMMMFDLDPEVAQQFIKDESKHATAADVSRASGITSLLPGSLIQDYVFDPCGYSMNGLLFDAYWTIHITPESHCSYASFETNLRMTNYSALVKAVLDIFRPKRFTMTMFADEKGLKAMRGGGFPLLYSVPLQEGEKQGLALVQDAAGDFVEAAGAAAAAAAAGAAAAARAAGEAEAGAGAARAQAAQHLAAARPPRPPPRALHYQHPPLQHPLRLRQQAAQHHHHQPRQPHLRRLAAPLRRTSGGPSRWHRTLTRGRWQSPQGWPRQRPLPARASQ
jgi:hypothetical protein